MAKEKQKETGVKLIITKTEKDLLLDVLHAEMRFLLLTKTKNRDLIWYKTEIEGFKETDSAVLLLKNTNNRIENRAMHVGNLIHQLERDYEQATS